MSSLVGSLVASHDAIRALNLKKLLGGDCLPSTGLVLAADFAVRDVPHLARPLLDEALERIERALAKLAG